MLDENSPTPQVTVSSGHPLLGPIPFKPGDERVCLARYTRCPDDEGSYRIAISLQAALVTVAEAATLLRVSRQTIRRLLRQDKLEKRQIGPETRITWESLVALAEIRASFSE